MVSDFQDFINACDSKDYDFIINNMSSLCDLLNKLVSGRYPDRKSHFMFLDEGNTTILNKEGKLEITKASGPFVFGDTPPVFDKMEKRLNDIKNSIDYVMKNEECDGAIESISYLTIKLYVQTDISPNLNYPKRIIHVNRELVNYNDEIWTSDDVADAYIILKNTIDDKEYLYLVQMGCYPNGLQWLAEYIKREEVTLDKLGFERVTKGFILFWRNQLSPFHALAPRQFESREEVLQSGMSFSVRTIRNPLRMEYQNAEDERANLPHYRVIIGSNQFTKIDGKWAGCIGNSWLKETEELAQNEEEAHIRYGVYGWAEVFNNPLEEVVPEVQESIVIQTSLPGEAQEGFFYVKLSDENYKKAVDRVRSRFDGITKRNNQH